MRDRERWFQVVMGQQAVDKPITADSAEATHPLPRAITESLAFDLSVAEQESQPARKQPARPGIQPSS